MSRTEQNRQLLATVNKMTDSTLGSSTLAAAYLMLAIISYRSSVNPNKEPAKQDLQTTDRLYHCNILFYRQRLLYMQIITIWLPLVYALFTVLPSLTCQNVNEDMFFSWSMTTIVFFTISYLLGFGRSQAMAQLGSDFNFALVKPKKGLQTGGLYTYVRHPSYTCGVAYTILVGGHLTRLDGILGCVIPRTLAGSSVLSVVLVLMSPAAWWTVGYRIADEEKFLKKEFGREWDEYAARRARLLPGIY